MPTFAYPFTRPEGVVDDYHGTRIADPYRWLEDMDAPGVQEWITAQNALTQSWLGQAAGRQRIVRRLTQLWDHPRAGAPWRRGQRWFQMRNAGLADQDALWTMMQPTAPGRIVLDPNLWSEDGAVSLAATEVSADGGLLAYATSAAGSDWMTWRVRDVETCRDHGDVLRWSKFAGAAWTPDNAGFFYTAYDPPSEHAVHEQLNQGQRLQYHRLGEPQQADRVVMAWPSEPEWGFIPTMSTDGRWLLVFVWRGTELRNRLWLADLGEGDRAAAAGGRGSAGEGDRCAVAGSPGPLIDEFDASYHPIGTDGDVVYVLTDLDAPLGRIIAVDVRRPARRDWREVVPQTGDRLESARLVGGEIVACYLHRASHRLRLFELDGRPAGEVPLEGLASVGAVSGREDDREFFFTSSGFTHSTDVRRHDLDTGHTTVIRAPGVAIEGVAVQQTFVKSRDGTPVSMFLVHRDDLERSGDLPTLLYGYGGFDLSLTPSCSLPWLVWLESGGLLAVANLRGGGEYGRSWYEAGRLERKQNVFDDFIACAEWLLGQGSDAVPWTRTGRLAINGASNGGLLVGACMTQRPDLFGACVPEVGVLDMLRFHTFTIGWAWTSDYGNPEDPEQFETLLAYSPLHNIRPGTSYPPTLVMTGDHDDRVVPCHSLKFAAALQAAQGGDAPILLRVETSAGHGRGTPTSKLIAQRADVLAFLFRALDVSPPAEADAECFAHTGSMHTPKRNQVVCPECGKIRLETPPGTTILPTIGMAKKAAGLAGDCSCGRKPHERPGALFLDDPNRDSESA